MKDFPLHDSYYKSVPWHVALRIVLANTLQRLGAFAHVACQALRRKPPMKRLLCRQQLLDAWAIQQLPDKGPPCPGLGRPPWELPWHLEQIDRKSVV